MIVAPSSSLDAREVKARADFFSIASRYIRLRRTGRQFVGLCPFHSERHESCYVEPRRKLWYCFGCNRGGDVFDLVMLAEDCDFFEALGIVSVFSGGSGARPASRAEATRRGLPPGREGFARPLHIARKTEARERSFSPANNWPSVEDCAAERGLFT